MKKLILIPFLFLTLSVFADKYYVSTTGLDSNPGDIDHPWLTANKAFTATPSGDTCYFRGGAYLPTSTISIYGTGNSGTYSAPTCFFEYPGERAIISGNSCNQSAGWPYYYPIIYIRQMHHLYFKGLEICYSIQRSTTIQATGVRLYREVNNIKFENCVFHHNGGIGVDAERYDTLLFINCDAHNNCDSIQSYDPGGTGVGFSLGNDKVAYPAAVSAMAYFKGCRTWANSDQGWGTGSDGLVVWDSCWMVANGYHWGIETEPFYQAYNGAGAKYDMAYNTNTADTIWRVMRNCISAYNEYHGLPENTYRGGTCQSQYYNNFCYSNGNNGIHYGGNNPTAGWGWNFRAKQDTIGAWNHAYWNNLSYNNNPTGDKIAHTLDYPLQRNYWEEEFYGLDNAALCWIGYTRPTVTDADFISLDTTGMCGPRQANGTLPFVMFGWLASTSDLIDAGIQRSGLPTYAGVAPDVGWVEYGIIEEEPPIEPVLSSIITVTPYWTSSTTAICGGNVIDDGGAPVTAYGICWSTSANPTTADSHTNDGTGTGLFVSYMTGLQSNTTYHVRAYATNSVGTSYGSDLTFRNSVLIMGGSGVNRGKLLVRNGKILIIE